MFKLIVSFYFLIFVFRKGEKKKTYKVNEKYENFRLSAELNELKSPRVNEKPDTTAKIYLLSLNIQKKDDPAIANDELIIVKKTFDTKYLFICSK